jgi:hypothetical protein
MERRIASARPTLTSRDISLTAMPFTWLGWWPKKRRRVEDLPAEEYNG